MAGDCESSRVGCVALTSCEKPVTNAAGLTCSLASVACSFSLLDAPLACSRFSFLLLFLSLAFPHPRHFSRCCCSLLLLVFRFLCFASLYASPNLARPLHLAPTARCRSPEILADCAKLYLEAYKLLTDGGLEYQDTTVRKPQTLNPKSQAPNGEVEYQDTTVRKPQTLNPKSQTPNGEVEYQDTTVRKPHTRNPALQTPNGWIEYHDTTVCRWGRARGVEGRVCVNWMEGWWLPRQVQIVSLGESREERRGKGSSAGASKSRDFCWRE